MARRPRTGPRPPSPRRRGARAGTFGPDRRRRVGLGRHTRRDRRRHGSRVAVRGGGRPTARAAPALLRRPRRPPLRCRGSHGDRDDRRCPASDLTILVDRHGATIHPSAGSSGPTSNPRDVARNIAELAGAGLTTEPSRSGPTPVPADPTSTRRRSAQRHRSGRARAGRRPAPDHDTPPRRLEPRRSPANRARRAVELVAYLALHQPDVITSDRLAHPGARVVRCRRRRQDAVQHRVRGASGHGPRHRRRTAVPGRHAHRPLPGVARGDGRRAPRHGLGGRGKAAR